MEINFIDESYIQNLLQEAVHTNDEEITEILNKAEAFHGLSHQEVAALLATKNPSHLERIFAIAGKIKEHIYGDRIVMFAPLYISDYCVNKCLYCGFKCDNKFGRKKLTKDEIRSEIKILEQMGHKRLAVEAGEDPVNCDMDYIIDCLQTIYAEKTKNGEIRRANINIAATTVENYKRLKAAQIGTYILFQETYHKPTYEQYHIAGPKANYLYHLTAFNRAMEGGIDDVGAGVLFGLYDPHFEVMGLLLHNEYLEKNYGVGFHTVSVPRICKAEGAAVESFPYAMDDATFKRIVAIIRLAIPFTGMIISTRESSEMRKELLKIGISQISAGSSVDVFGYTRREEQNEGDSQFELADSRNAPEIIGWLMDAGYVPSFCTACYRGGRTGDRFMRLAKSGNIKNVCTPNALMTLWEYAQDYGDEQLIQKAERLIREKIEQISNEQVKNQVKESIEKISQGQRDFFI